MTKETLDHDNVARKSLKLYLDTDKMKQSDKKEAIKKLIISSYITILDVTEEVLKLGGLYMNHGAIPKSEPEDAYHLHKLHLTLDYSDLEKLNSDAMAKFDAWRAMTNDTLKVA